MGNKMYRKDTGKQTFCRRMLRHRLKFCAMYTALMHYKISYQMFQSPCAFCCQFLSPLPVA